jgi:hypothetical protein
VDETERGAGMVIGMICDTSENSNLTVMPGPPANTDSEPTGGPCSALVALDALGRLPACPAAVGPRPYVPGGYAVGDGKANPIRARDVRDVATEARRALGGWPRFMPGGLFIETEAGAVRAFADDSAAFKAWCALRVELRLPTSTVDACDLPAPGAKFSEIVAIWRETGRHHAAVSDLPHHPPLPGVYYPAGAERACTGDPGELWRFIELLPPAATPADEVALVAFVVTPRYGQTANERPAFMFTSPDGQGSGKSTTVRSVGKVHRLTGKGSIDLAQIQQRPLATLLLTPGADAPIVHLENPVGTIDGSEWAQIQTAESVDGHQLHYGLASKPNMYTYAASVNPGDLTLSEDLRSRFIEIAVRKLAVRDAGPLDAFLGSPEGPAGVRAACMAMLRGGASEGVHKALAGCHRSERWVRTVLAPVVEAVAAHRGMDALELAHAVATKLRAKPMPNALVDRDAFLAALDLAVNGRKAVIVPDAIDEFIGSWCKVHKAKLTQALAKTLASYVGAASKHRVMGQDKPAYGYKLDKRGDRAVALLFTTLADSEDAIRRWLNGEVPSPEAMFPNSEAMFPRLGGGWEQNHVGPTSNVPNVPNVPNESSQGFSRARVPESGELIGKQTEHWEHWEPCPQGKGFQKSGNGTLPGTLGTLGTMAELAINRVAP